MSEVVKECERKKKESTSKNLVSTFFLRVVYNMYIYKQIKDKRRGKN